MTEGSSNSLELACPVVSSDRDRRRAEGSEEGEGVVLVGQRSAALPISTLSTGTYMEKAMACCMAGEASEVDCMFSVKGMEESTQMVPMLMVGCMVLGSAVGTAVGKLLFTVSNAGAAVNTVFTRVLVGMAELVWGA